MRYFIYRKYIKVFRYVRNHNIDRMSQVEEKFGKRGKEALSILESRKGIIFLFPNWEKSVCVIDNIINEYEDKKSQFLWIIVGTIISFCTLCITIKTFLLNYN